MWSLPVPKDSSPQTLHMPASMRLPKYFQPVGVSKNLMPSSLATRSSAAPVGMLRATPCAQAANYRFFVGIDS